MKSRVHTYFLLPFLLFVALAASAKDAKESTEKLVLSTRVSPADPVEGEPVMYEIVLQTSNPAVAGTMLKTPVQFEDFTVVRQPADSRLHEETVKGKKVYAAVIDRYKLLPKKTGKCRIPGGEYVVAMRRQVLMNDPFWGQMIGEDVEELEFKADDVKFSVAPLPEKGKPDTFSGAVGVFDISIDVPRGEIRKGENAIAVLTVKGEGSLMEDMMPDIISSFPSALSFKSASPRIEEYITADDKLGTELEIECSFVPAEEGKFIIDPVEFVYFDKKSKKYGRIKTQPIEIEVLPADIPDSPPVLIDI